MLRQKYTRKHDAVKTQSVMTVHTVGRMQLHMGAEMQNSQYTNHTREKTYAPICYTAIHICENTWQVAVLTRHEP